MTTDQQMTEWKKYCDLFKSTAPRADLLIAVEAMKDEGNRKVAMLNLGVTTAKDRREIKARWKSINAVTDKECRAHCQLEGVI